LGEQVRCETANRTWQTEGFERKKALVRELVKPGGGWPLKRRKPAAENLNKEGSDRGAEIGRISPPSPHDVKYVY